MYTKFLGKLPKGEGGRGGLADLIKKIPKKPKAKTKQKKIPNLLRGEEQSASLFRVSFQQKALLLSMELHGEPVMQPNTHKNWKDEHSIKEEYKNIVRALFDKNE